MQNIYEMPEALATVIKKKHCKRVLFANFPADGHFNPLTGLAMQLKEAGFEIAWYSSNTYKKKLDKLQVKHYPFKAAVDVSDNDFDKTFPGRLKCKTQISKLKFDIVHAFILRGPEYYTDIQEIYAEFPFDIMIADIAFTGIPFVKDLMQIPVVSIGIFPLSETSKDLAPSGLAMEPSYTYAGKIKQWMLRTVAARFIFGQPNKVMKAMLNQYNIPHNNESVFDVMVKKSTLVLQSGTPGFEYYRSDLSKNIRFVGPLLPYNSTAETAAWYDKRLVAHEKIVLVTQGTVEKDIEKILVPTLQAFKNTDVLVVATTGGNDTQKLRARFPDQNFIIEDFIPFSQVMPYADVYVTNGGYGGVLLGIENKLPMVVAGVHEGKNEINARVGYFKLGVNLKTESPTPEKIRAAVGEVFTNDLYKQNVDKLAREFSQYDPKKLFAKYLNELLYPEIAKIKTLMLQVPAN